MLKLFIGICLFATLALTQELILCSGYIKINKNELEQFDLSQLELQLFNKKDEFIRSINVSDKGYYTLEITELNDYYLKPKTNNPYIQSDPKRLEFNFSSKSDSEARTFCQKQQNIQLFKTDTIEQNEQQNEEVAQQVQIEYYCDYHRVQGSIQFEGQYSNEELKLYKIKSVKVVNDLEGINNIILENVKGKILHFQKYFEFEYNEQTADFKIEVTVEKDKEKGEASAKQYKFEESIQKSSFYQSRQIPNIVFKISKESTSKDQNKVSQVITPLVIFGLVICIFNYDKILKRM